MKRGRRGAARRLLPIVLLAVSTMSLAPLRAASVLPVELEDVASGRLTEVAAGPAALHIVLWASWCPPCVQELERLAELEQRWGDRGYRLVVVAVQHRHTRDRLVKLQQQRHPPGLLLFDESGQVQRLLDVEQLPTHIVFDSEGNEVGRAGSLRDGIEEAIEALLQPGDAKR